MLDTGARIVLIDDEPQMLKVIERMLRSLGHEVVAVGDAAKGIALATSDSFDLLISDIKMPKITGIEVARRVRLVNPDIPVLLVTGFPELDTARAAIRVGVDGYVTKPVQLAELDEAIKTALAKKTGTFDRTLDELLSLCKAAGDMEKKYIDVLREIARLVEAGNEYARGHMARVGTLAEKLARRLDIPKDDVAAIRLAAELRDIGMIGVPVSVLTKGEALTPAERRVVQTHPTIGAGLLARLPVPSLVHRIVLHHHDRYDGKDGKENPSGLPSKEIPLAGYVVAVVDAFDAMTSDRPWRKAFKRQAALSMVAEESGRQFHPTVAKAFLELMESERRD